MINLKQGTKIISLLLLIFLVITWFLILNHTIVEKNMKQKKTILKQAYEKVNGFGLLHEKMKQKMSITGRMESTSENYCNRIAKISVYFKNFPQL